MMPSLIGTPNLVGMPQHHVPNGAYTFDTMLNELSRQLVGNTRRYSRSSNGQQRSMGNAMRISKPGSANNSPRTSTMQSRRRTLIGDGFRGGFQTQSPAAEQIYLPTPSSETPNELLYERSTTARPARPVSWHPSSQYSQFSQHHGNNNNAALYPYATRDELEMLASLQHLPPTPAGVYSGYASPAECFSPLSLPYSHFSSSQAFCSPLSQPVPAPQQQQPQQQQAPAFPSASPCANYPPSTVTTLSDIPYLPPAYAAPAQNSWEPYPAYPSNTAFLARQTAPPTPEDLACSLAPAQQQQSTTTTTYPEPVIVDNDNNNNELDNNDDTEEGEILYGMGLYDAPSTTHQGKGKDTLHRSVVLSLLGGDRDAREEEDDEEGVESGKGLGLKLEDAWEPPASPGSSEDGEEGEEEDGEGEGEE